MLLAHVRQDDLRAYVFGMAATAACRLSAGRGKSRAGEKAVYKERMDRGAALFVLVP